MRNKNNLRLSESQSISDEVKNYCPNTYLTPANIWVTLKFIYQRLRKFADIQNTFFFLVPICVVAETVNSHTTEFRQLR